MEETPTGVMGPQQRARLDGHGDLSGRSQRSDDSTIDTDCIKAFLSLCMELTLLVKQATVDSRHIREHLESRP
jgi:hypothetical protein